MCFDEDGWSKQVESRQDSDLADISVYVGDKYKEHAYTNVRDRGIAQKW
jgi:hypothetical protein